MEKWLTDNHEKPFGWLYDQCPDYQFLNDIYFHYFPNDPLDVKNLLKLEEPLD